MLLCIFNIRSSLKIFVEIIKKNIYLFSKYITFLLRIKYSKETKEYIYFFKIHKIIKCYQNIPK